MKHREPSRHDPRKPIRSAETVAWCRALAHLEPNPPVSCPDSLAHIFLNPVFRILLRPAPFWRWLTEKKAPGLYHLHFGRTLYIDDALRDGVANGASQLVLLGAGYDSRPYRMHDGLRGARVFEVDFPGTQERKKRCLRKHFGELPDHVTFVPIDFEVESLDEGLGNAGYDPQAKTVFLWEGVCCFLTPEAVDEVVRFVSHNSAPGSRLVFDLWDGQVIEGDHSAFGAKQLMRVTAKIGEPIIWGLHRGGRDDELPEWLASRGLDLVDASTPEQMERRYFGSDTRRRMMACFRMVTSEVRSSQ
ncbi:MAG: SAM-dependent methyltransferase [Thermoanaerobaculia bacterium]|nr:SAM-dependent methyltransferase [Thermoanaerobaculia bacterium]